MFLQRISSNFFIRCENKIRSKNVFPNGLFSIFLFSLFPTETAIDSSLDPIVQSVDFKGEAITFKATSEGVLATLQHCVELMSQMEDSWRRKWEKEAEKKRKMQELCKALKDQIALNRGETTRPRVHIHGGPDYEVPHLYSVFSNSHPLSFCKWLVLLGREIFVALDRVGSLAPFSHQRYFQISFALRHLFLREFRSRDLARTKWRRKKQT